MAKFTYNNRQHLSTEKLPFFMNLGRYPNTYGQEKVLTEKILEMDKFIYRIREVRKKVEEALRKTNKIIKMKADKK